MENTIRQLSNGSSIFELFATIYLALSIAGKLLSIENIASISPFSNFLRYVVFGNLTEESNRITANISKIKGETASIIELTPNKTFPTEHKKAIEFDKEMQNLVTDAERIGENLKNFITEFTESIDTFIVRSSAILASYCIFALIISAILPKIEVLAIIALNVGTTVILLRMVSKSYTSRSESLYRSMIIDLVVLIAVILVVLPLISSLYGNNIRLNETLSNWAVIITILIPPAYFLVIIAYYIIYSEKKMDLFLSDFEIHLDNLERFGRDFKIFKNQFSRQLNNP